MRKYYVKRKNFLNWFFKSGDNDTIRESKIDLADQVIKDLIEKGSFSISTRDVWLNCEHSAIPLYITEGHKKGLQDNVELGDLEDYEVYLIV